MTRHPRPSLLGPALLGIVLMLPPPLVVAQSSGTSPAVRGNTLVTLNFVNADIEAVSRAMGAMLDRQMLIDPRVKGTVTVYSERPVTVQEAYRNYLAALRGLGFTVVENAGLLKVVPEAEAKLQAGTVSVDGVSRRGDQILTQIFRLNHENPNNLVAVLRPLISPNNTINANPGTSSLIITDYADNLQRIARIIAALDQPASTDFEIIPLRHAVATDMAALVQRLSESGTTPGVVPGAVPQAGGGVSVLADPRSNSLIVRAANPARLAQIRLNVAKLDVPGQGGGPGGNIWVVYLKNADATKLATVLRAAFASGGSGAAGGGSSGGSGSLSAGSALGASPVNTGVAGTGAATPATTPVAASAAPSTGGFIQADPATNSLIITAAEPLYRQIRNVIDQLDSRRAQVFVESMIVKMDANKAAEFGFQWQGMLGSRGDRNIVVGGTNFGSGGNNIINLAVGGATGEVAPGAGLNIGLVRQFGGVYTLASLARFLETNTGANILSTPTLMALDNEEAKIVIGQNVPFITGSFTNTGGGNGNLNPFQTIERKDVGLTLRIKSQIGEGGTVRMTVFQENSSVVPGASTAAGPTTDKSAIETTVSVDDGSIVVLGGLLKDEYTDGEDRVPGLGSLPVVGNLFRSENRRRVKSNLMVFLRPVVVRDTRSAEALTLDRYDTIRAMQKDSQPAPHLLLPVTDAPVLPPQRAPQPADGAASAPPPRQP